MDKIQVSIFAVLSMIYGDPQEELREGARRGKKVMVESALRANAHINWKDKEGITPLMWAAICKHTNILAILLSHRADIGIGDNKGQTALMWAAASGCSADLKLLIKGGAQIDKRDIYDRTALHYAFMNGHLDGVRLLLKSRADPNIQSRLGDTVFQTAIDRDDKKMLKCLICAEVYIPEALRDNQSVLEAIACKQKVAGEFFDLIRANGTTKKIVLRKIRRLEKEGYCLAKLRSVNGNNILHMLPDLSPKSKVAKFLLFYFPALLLKPNAKGDTPFFRGVGAGPRMQRLFMEGIAAMPDSFKEKIWSSLSDKDKEEAVLLARELKKE